MGRDEKLFHLLNGFAGISPVFDRAIIFFANEFQYIVVAALFLLVYFSKLSDRHKLRLLWTTVLSFMFARFVVVEAVRLFYHRPRPFAGIAADALLTPAWFYTSSEWSFPSGHATFFFALATAVFLYNKKWGYWFYAAALTISVSRVMAGVHYPTDILAGALLGSAVAFVMFHFIERRTFLKD